MSILVFGGSFNPPHLAHVLAVCLARAQHDFERILVIPTFQHAFGKPLAPFENRMVMSERAFGWIPGVEVSRLEQRLGGESRTVRTLEALRAAHPHTPLRLLVGADILHETGQWLAFDRIVALAPLLVVGRAGVAHPDAPQVMLPQISSTEIRQLLDAGNHAALAQRLPATVHDYIRQQGLYARSSSEEHS